MIYGGVETFTGLANYLKISINLKDKHLNEVIFKLDKEITKFSINFQEYYFIDELLYWNPEKHTLLDIKLELLKDSFVCESIKTRFAFRKISIDGEGNICLNNKKYYQRLVLDQGYFNDSGLTPPSIEALKNDILVSKELGFNGARKHQKFEDPYYYYYADELGFLVWCELPSVYSFNKISTQNLVNEWMEIVKASNLFTSIICYVPLNESWGTKKILTDKNQQNLAKSLYFLTKSLDSTRLVSTNDGWKNINPTDFISIHGYLKDGEDILNKLGDLTNLDELYPQGRKLISYGNSFNTKLSILFTEFGGIALDSKESDLMWGYNELAKNNNELIDRIKDMLEAIKACDFQGFCYTQLSDVQQEINGLMDKDHNLKFELNDKTKDLFKI